MCAVQLRKYRGMRIGGNMIQFVLCIRSVSYMTGFLSMCKQTLMETTRFAYPRRQVRLTGVRVNAELLRDYYLHATAVYFDFSRTFSFPEVLTWKLQVQIFGNQQVAYTAFLSAGKFATPQRSSYTCRTMPK